MKMCSGITRGRLLNGEVYVQRFQKLILSAFIYRLVHEDFSSNVGTNAVAYSQLIKHAHFPCLNEGS